MQSGSRRSFINGRRKLMCDQGEVRCAGESACGSACADCEVLTEEQVVLHLSVNSSD